MIKSDVLKKAALVLMLSAGGFATMASAQTESRNDETIYVRYLGAEKVQGTADHQCRREVERKRAGVEAIPAYTEVQKVEHYKHGAYPRANIWCGSTGYWIGQGRQTFLETNDPFTVLEVEVAAVLEVGAASK